MDISYVHRWSYIELNGQIYTLKSPPVPIVIGMKPSVAKPGNGKLEDSSGSMLIWGPGLALLNRRRAKRKQESGA